jgi:hypothetical protein
LVFRKAGRLSPIGIASRKEVKERFMRAMTTGKRAAPFIGFAEERALWRTLTPLRGDILKVMTGRLT